MGLTPEEADSRDQIEDFLHDVHITWPNGYGASETIDSLGVDAIPRIFVIGPDGMITWNNELGGTLDFAIEKAIALARMNK